MHDLSRVISMQKHLNYLDINVCDGLVVEGFFKEFSGVVCQHKRLESLMLRDNDIGVAGLDEIIHGLTKNTTIRGCNITGNLYYYQSNSLKNTIQSLEENNFTILDFKFDCFVADEVHEFQTVFCKRNFDLQWRFVQKVIVDISLAFLSVNLPPYVILWILDWFPHWNIHSEWKKINVITKVLSLQK